MFDFTRGSPGYLSHRLFTPLTLCQVVMLMSCNKPDKPTRGNSPGLRRPRWPFVDFNANASPTRHTRDRGGYSNFSRPLPLVNEADTRTCWTGQGGGYWSNLPRGTEQVRGSTALGTSSVRLGASCVFCLVQTSVSLHTWWTFHDVPVVSGRFISWMNKVDVVFIHFIRQGISVSMLYSPMTELSNLVSADILLVLEFLHKR